MVPSIDQMVSLEIINMRETLSGLTSLHLYIYVVTNMQQSQRKKSARNEEGARGTCHGGLKGGKTSGKWCHILIYKLKNDLTVLQTHSAVCTHTHKYILIV